MLRLIPTPNDPAHLNRVGQEIYVAFPQDLEVPPSGGCGTAGYHHRSLALATHLARQAAARGSFHATPDTAVAVERSV